MIRFVFYKAHAIEKTTEKKWILTEKMMKLQFFE
jgi:hypothetical protein